MPIGGWVVWRRQLIFLVQNRWCFFHQLDGEASPSTVSTVRQYTVRWEACCKSAQKQVHQPLDLCEEYTAQMHIVTLHIQEDIKTLCRYASVSPGPRSRIGYLLGRTEWFMFKISHHFSASRIARSVAILSLYSLSRVNRFKPC